MLAQDVKPGDRILLDDGRIRLSVLSSSDGEVTARIEEGGALLDAVTRRPVAPSGELERVSINNRVRRTLERALAALGLFAPSAAERLAAARELQNSADETVFPLVERAISQEKNGQVKDLLISVQGGLLLASPDRDKRLAAIDVLGQSPSTHNKRLLVARLGRDAAEPGVETDPAVREALERGIKGIEGSLQRAEIVGWIFGGLSLGSILLLAALGLAITFGLMGVINMAHGELLMIGAYATYVVQTVFRSHFPGALSWYLAAAIPAAFLAAGLVGLVLELTVVRALYGRPLDAIAKEFCISVWYASKAWIDAGYEVEIPTKVVAS